MNGAPTTQQWNPMLSGSGNDFADFLDFANLDFSTFDDSVPNLEHHGVAPNHKGGKSIDHAMEGTPEVLREGSHEDLARLEEQRLPANISLDTSFDAFGQAPNPYAAQRQGVGTLDQQQWHMPNMVPPTPNSLDLQAGHVQPFHGHPNDQQQQVYEHYRRLQKEQYNFTPLISPAVTPLETQLRYTDGLNDPFSPLTSPALQAQPHRSQSSRQANLRGLDKSAKKSPLDLSFDPKPQNPASTVASARRSRRRMSSSSVKNPARSVKQSPVVKAQQKKKQTSSATVTPKEVAAILEQVNQNTASQVPSITSDGKNLAMDSSADSVSPESLSEILMPPPVTPQSSSAGRSPHLHEKPLRQLTDKQQNEEPATPASLMRIKKQTEKTVGGVAAKTARLREQAASAEVSMENIMEAIELPAPATNRSKAAEQLHAVDITQNPLAASMANGPTRESHGSAPATAATSTFTSPLVSANASTSDLQSRKGPESKPKGRESKKRNSMSNNENASPAIRPRISPSIKPLLPEGATVSPETSALLLASKSNYQNILEGTHFPGVSYPENLSTNLTSKRTSHKIAEQGRRNRINTALQEIAQLLPPSPAILPNNVGKPAMPNSGNGVDPVVEKDGPASTAANIMMSPNATAQQQSNSKASTVEAAIDYIKSLQREITGYKEKLAEYESDKGKSANVIGEAEMATATTTTMTTTTTKTTTDEETTENGNSDGD